MAISGLSEFMFGYGFLYEQTLANWPNLKAAPVLPSLAVEADEGWDARLPTYGTDFYYQFKLSSYLSRSNSLFHKDGTYTSPYYRIDMHRRDFNRQHNTLVTHASRHPGTFYVAPQLTAVGTFNTAFLAGQVAAVSRLLPLRCCAPYNDDEQHYITFQSGTTSWLQHSEPTKHEESYLGTELEDIYRRSEQRWRPIDRDFAGSVVEGLATALQSDDRVNLPRLLDKEEEVLGGELRDIYALIDWAMDSSNTRTILARAAQIAAVGLGASLVLVGVDG